MWSLGCHIIGCGSSVSASDSALLGCTLLPPRFELCSEDISFSFILSSPCQHGPSEPEQGVYVRFLDTVAESRLTQEEIPHPSSIALGRIKKSGE